MGKKSCRPTWKTVDAMQGTTDSSIITVCASQTYNGE